MKIRRFFCFFLLLCNVSAFSSAYAAANVGQTIQISTQFNSVVGKPSWLLIIRDEDSGRVLPYVYDILNNDNFWIALTWDRNYRITASKLSWDTYTVITNFCHLENKLLKGKSLIIRLRGKLTPNRNNAACDVIEYKDYAFPIVNPQAES